MVGVVCVRGRDPSRWAGPHSRSGRPWRPRERRSVSAGIPGSGTGRGCPGGSPRPRRALLPGPALRGQRGQRGAPARPLGLPGLAGRAGPERCLAPLGLCFGGFGGFLIIFCRAEEHSRREAAMRFQQVARGTGMRQNLLNYVKNNLLN